METYLIAGLGNFGEKYKNTRHNTGFMAVDRLAKRLGVNISEERFKALTGVTIRDGSKLLLMKPLTWMNLSGEAVSLASSYLEIPPDHIIIILDDIYLDVGRIRVRGRGSAGGHNGLKSIIECLQSEEFVRVRIGIGPKTNEKEDLADFVLGRFDKDLAGVLDRIFDEASEAVLDILDEGVTKAMDRYNGIDCFRPDSQPETIKAKTF